MNPLLENIFQNVKKFGTKILHAHPDILCSRTNFRKERTFFVSPIKKINLCMHIWLFTGHIFYLFYRCHIKCSSLSKTYVGTLNVLIYMQNLFLNFLTFWNLYFYVFSIIGSYRPGSQKHLLRSGEVVLIVTPQCKTSPKWLRSRHVAMWLLQIRPYTYLYATCAHTTERAFPA
jgi:hypothetical protein